MIRFDVAYEQGKLFGVFDSSFIYPSSEKGGLNETVRPLAFLDSPTRIINERPVRRLKELK